jgi:phage baseplate assembly protein W
MAHDRFKETNNNSYIYSDFLTNLNRHPVSGDVVRFVNENAVIRSIKNLLLTDRGERLCQPDIGSGIKNALFEPMLPSTAQMIRSLIMSCIEKHEPRARILSVDVEPDEDKHLYRVSISAFIINKPAPVSFNITLDRVR